jgi:hypothetical protein
MDELLPALAWPVTLRYALPALVLVALLWSRLAPRTRVAALGVVLVFAGARVIHLLLITRLTIDQLYANWRGMGELILAGLVAVTLTLTVTVWELGAWAARPRVRAASAPPLVTPTGSPRLAKGD